MGLKQLNNKIINDKRQRMPSTLPTPCTQHNETYNDMNKTPNRNISRK